MFLRDQWVNRDSQSVVFTDLSQTCHPMPLAVAIDRADAAGASAGSSAPTAGILEVTVDSASGIHLTTKPHHVVVRMNAKRWRAPCISTEGNDEVIGHAARYYVPPDAADYLVRVEIFSGNPACGSPPGAGLPSRSALLGAAEVPLKILKAASSEQKGVRLELDLRDKCAGLERGDGPPAMARCSMRMLPPLQVRRSFWQSFAQVVDTNGDGWISPEELGSFLSFLGNDAATVHTWTTAATPQKKKVAEVVDQLATSADKLLHFDCCPMTGKPFSDAVRSDEYVVMCQLIQRMLKAEHGTEESPDLMMVAVPASPLTTGALAVYEAAFLHRGWLSCISEWKAIGDMRVWGALEQRACAARGGQFAHDGRKVKNRRTGQLETEFVPGKVWLARGKKRPSLRRPRKACSCVIVVMYW